MTISGNEQLTLQCGELFCCFIKDLLLIVFGQMYTIKWIAKFLQDARQFFKGVVSVFMAIFGVNLRPIWIY